MRNRDLGNWRDFFYADYVKKAMPGLNSRNQYRDCIVYLKKLSTYPEGLNIARKIAQEWRETYRNRPGHERRIVQSRLLKSEAKGSLPRRAGRPKAV